MTTFANADEFKLMLDNGADKVLALQLANDKLFDYIKIADSQELAQIMAPELIIPPDVISQNACQDNCMNVCSTNMDVAWGVFLGSSQAAATDDNLLWGAVMTYFAAVSYHASIADIVTAYNNCYFGC